MKKKLAILIPTYNRINSLITNLNTLENHFNKLVCHQDIKVIISDNCSTDKTFDYLEKFVRGKKTEYEIFMQNKNIGLEKNAIFCLEHSDAEYSMYLGDDDFLDFEYLKSVLSYLNDKEVTCIIPNFYTIDTEFKETGKLRDEVVPDKIYTKGSNMLELMFKAHQLSGVTIKTIGTLNSYNDKGGNNIYLFMYFAAFNIKRGKTVHITEFPVKVTSTNKKDWDYRNDGLITDVLQNIEMIAESKNEKFYLERYFLKANKWRYLNYSKNPFLFLNVVFRSNRYSYILKLYVVLRMIIDSSSSRLKIVVKSLVNLLGYEIVNRELLKKVRD